MKIYTDGSSLGNPGPGGFGVVVVDDNDELLFCHAKIENEDTTNNRQEMLAILYAVVRYGRVEPTPQVYSDSAYAINTFTDWMYKWRDNNWLRSNNSIPENLDIVKFYYELVVDGGFKIDLHKIKGHSGIIWNEVADQLAKGELKVNEAIEKYGK